jgi:hypothetical protein
MSQPLQLRDYFFVPVNFPMGTVPFLQFFQLAPQVLQFPAQIVFVGILSLAITGTLAVQPLMQLMSEAFEFFPQPIDFFLHCEFAVFLIIVVACIEIIRTLTPILIVALIPQPINGMSQCLDFVPKTLSKFAGSPSIVHCDISIRLRLMKSTISSEKIC